MWPRFYYEVYWGSEIVEFVLTYLLIFELWHQGLRLYRGIWLFSRWVFGFVFLGVLVVVWATTQYGQGAAAQPGHWLNDWMFLLDRSVLFTQAMFLLAFFVVLGFFRVLVTSLVRRLALCWFAYSLVGVALYSLRYFLGPATQPRYSWLFPFASVMLLAFWTSVVWTSQPEAEVEVAPVFALRGKERQIVIEQLESLNNSLIRILKA